MPDITYGSAWSRIEAATRGLVPSGNALDLVRRD